MQEFADLFKADYETLKSAGSLNGSGIKNLDDYLDNIEKMGEFDHKMDQPFKSFVSGLLDITIIIPFIECATGYDLITGEDLTSFELTMKGVFAVVDLFTLGTAVLATKPFEVGGMAAVKLAGRTIAVTMASDATAYTVGYLSNQAGAPLAITMLLSMGSGIAVTKVAGKYFFKNAAGELLGECNVPGESVDVVKSEQKILTDSEAEEYAFNAINGSNKSESIMLGKYEEGSLNSYDEMAKDYGSQYFHLKNWDELSRNYSKEEIWKINQKFLDIETSSGREIYLSHNPFDYIGGDSFYSSEIKYLQDAGYKFVREGDIWHAIR